MLMYGPSIVLLHIALGHRPSPCPGIFEYEPLETTNQWYGVIAVAVSRKLREVWIRVQVDQEAEQLGNWFGNATSEDGRDFLIHYRSDHQPLPNPLLVQFFISYKAGCTVPSLKGIELNGKAVCPASRHNAAAGPPVLYLSRFLSTFDTNDSFPGDYWLSKCPMCKLDGNPTLALKADTKNTGLSPWHASIYRYMGVSMVYVCAGSLISKDYVITAAHCVTHSRSSIPIDTEIFLVFLGKVSLDKQDSNVQTNTIKQILVHPRYNATYFQNNLGVLHLESSAQIADFVRPACLWKNDLGSNLLSNKSGIVTGWGLDENSEIGRSLKQSNIPIVTSEVCTSSSCLFFKSYVSKQTYCAGFENGTSAYVGDSGAGMVFSTMDNPGNNLVWRLRGVVSLSAILNEKVVCGTSNYIVFEDIARHLKWLHSVVKS